jgi:hypothetical protein
VCSFEFGGLENILPSLPGDRVPSFCQHRYANQVARGKDIIACNQIHGDDEIIDRRGPETKVGFWATCDDSFVVYNDEFQNHRFATVGH